MAEVSNYKSCGTCSKMNVCKYSDEVQEKVRELAAKIEGLTLPLNVNIGCKEFSSGSTLFR